MRHKVMPTLLKPVRATSLRLFTRRDRRGRRTMALDATGFSRRKYGQRWMAETVYSVIKRKFGEALTARRPWQQVTQGLLRGLTYNLYRAVRLGLIVCQLLRHRLTQGSLVLAT
jgi:hypothetical protein